MDTKQRSELAYRIVDRVCEHLREQSIISQGVDPQVRSRLFIECEHVLYEYDIYRIYRRKAAQAADSCLIVDLVFTINTTLETAQKSRAFQQHIPGIKQEIGSILESFALHDG